uniref:Protein KASH5 n=1 Tax=Geotrypetes seraphini TaxID=260995 RepID=A0A6P8SDK9_GEOSA|nr:protein KASH5 [Geotrypetes seraphini]
MDGQELGEASIVISDKSSSSLPDVTPASGCSMTPLPNAGSQDIFKDATFHGPPSLGRCSEAVMLEYAFQACDLEGTGKVSASRILEYLQCVTGQSREGEGLCSLYRRLDPDESGVSVDLQTFHAVMGEWIAERRQERANEGTKDGSSCLKKTGLLQSGKASVPGTAQLEGYGGDTQKFSLREAVDLMSKIEDLEYANKKLTAENGKLQRSIEVLEEASARLSEEIIDLKSKLRASQQALQIAKSAASELEELKTVVKSLEEKNGQLQAQSRQLEKERQCLSSQVQNLQEVNEKLLAERVRARHKIDQLASETVDLQHQLGDYENFLIRKDVLLRQSVNQAEELKETLEEYQDMIQELKAEIIQLQKQLSQTYIDILKFPEESLGTSASAQKKASQLCLEIEDVEQGGDMDIELINPLCRTFLWPDRATAPTLQDELLGTWEEISDLNPCKGIEELVVQVRQGTEALLNQVKQLTDTGNVLDWMAEVQSLAHGLEQASETLLQRFDCLSSCKAAWESHLGSLKIQMHTYQQKEQQRLWPDVRSRTDVSPQTLALLPVKNQLVPFSRPPSKPDRQLWLVLVQGAPVLAFLLLLLLLSTLLSGDVDRIWTTTRGVFWPHIQLRYLKPPPV